MSFYNDSYLPIIIKVLKTLSYNFDDLYIKG